MFLGAQVRNTLITARMASRGMFLGPREQLISRGLREGFPGTHGTFREAPGQKTRVSNLTGPGATFSFSSQQAGANAFIAFASDVNRNFHFTQSPVYGRLGTPRTEDLETRMVGLVGGDFEHIEAVSLATGQSANVLALKMFSYTGVAPELEARRALEGHPLPQELLRRGHHGIIVQKGGMYGCSFDHVRELAEYEGRDVHVMDLSDLDSVRDTIKANPHVKVIFCEALNNPNVSLLDIQALAKLRNEINHEKGYEGDDKIKIVVDLTFTTTQIRPFEWDKELWPDAVTISGTKLVAGGSHMAGFIIAPRENIIGKRGALYLRKDTGGIMADPVAEDILDSGLSTILERARLNSGNAGVFAKAFEHDDRVTVYHPSLPSFPQYDLARRIMRDHDGMFAPSHMVRVRLNISKQAEPQVALYYSKRVIAGIADPQSLDFKLWPGLTYAVSLGNDRSLISQPVSTTQAVMALINSPVLPEVLECGPQDLRLSLGWLASPERAIDHFKYALDQAYGWYRS